MAWPTYTAGQVLTAAQLNTLGVAWSTYTPAWTAATTNPALGNGTIVGRYMQVGKTWDVAIKLTMGSTTTYGSGQFALSLPFTVALDRTQGQVDIVITSGSTNLKGRAVAIGSKVYLDFDGTTAGGAQRALDGSYAWVAGNTVVVNLRFEST